jgi:hypothetical protein
MNALQKDDSIVLATFYKNPLTRHDHPSAAKRFIDFAREGHECFEVFGVFRTEVLARTRLIQPYTGSDRSLLAEIALHGKISIDPGFEFISRQHAEQSVKIPLHYRSRWFDPNSKRSFSFVEFRTWGEYWRALFRAPGSVSTKLWCALYLVVYPFSSKVYARGLSLELWEFTKFSLGMTDSRGQRTDSRLWIWHRRIKNLLAGRP